MRLVWMAVAAALLLAGCALVPPDAGTETVPAVSAASPATSPATPSPLAALTLGTCTGPVTKGGEPADSVATKPCTTAHSWEVAAVVPLTGTNYPGEIELKSQAAATCRKAFEDYVGVAVESSPYSVTFVGPSESHWPNPDARELVCLVGSELGGLTSSLKNHPVVFAELGQCLRAPVAGSTSFTLADCAKSHLYEVYASTTFTGAKAPTQAQLDKAYAKTCVAGFAKFVGVKLAKSKYEIQYFALPSSLWKKYADHRLVCSVGSPSGGITGTLKGSKK